MGQIDITSMVIAWVSIAVIIGFTFVTLILFAIPSFAAAFGNFTREDGDDVFIIKQKAYDIDEDE